MRTILKIRIVLGMFLLIPGLYSYTQVSINTDSSQPDSSAMLDVKSNNKGFLPPRVALLNINTSYPITSPAIGLLIYNTANSGAPPNNVMNGYYYWNGTQWISFIPPNLWTQIGIFIFPKNNSFIATNQGYLSTYFGDSCGNPNGIDLENTAFGYHAFYEPQDTVGNGADMYGANSAFGEEALRRNTHGSMNTAMGYAAMTWNISGWRNTAIGYKSLYSNTTGHENVAVGEHSLVNNTTGYYNTAIGTQSMNNSITTRYNTALGYNSLFSITTGEKNTVLGFQAGEFMNNAGDCVYIGSDAGRNTVTNGANVGIGNEALTTNTTGHSNTAIGMESMQYNDIGTNNTALGRRSLYHYYGHYSVGLGAFSLQSATTGGYNTAIGANAGLSLTTGYNNVFVGEESAYNNIAGIGNIFLGIRSGYYGSGNNQLIINNWSGGMDTALIYGLFANSGRPYIQLNGTTQIKDTLFSEGTDILDGLPEVKKSKILYFDPTTHVVSMGDSSHTSRGNDSTWIDNGFATKKQTSLRDTVQMKIAEVTSGVIAPNVILSESDTSVAVKGKSVFISADSSFYDCRSTISAHKWWKRKY